MRVVPEKSDGGTNHGSAKNGELANLRHALQFEISCKSRMAAEIGEDGERSRCNHRATDGEPVKAIGKIHSVARKYDDKHYENHEGQEGQGPDLRMKQPALDHQVGMELFEEWNHEPGGVFSAMLQRDQCDRNHDAGGRLIAQLGARGKAEIAAVNDFKVVVGKTDGAKRQRGKHG